MGRKEDLLGFVEKPIKSYEDLFQCEISVDISVLDECFCKVEDSLQKNFSSFEAPQGYEPSLFKMAGVICFWLRKLKPLSVRGKEKDNRFVNETVAFLVGYHLVYKFSIERGLRRPHIPASYFHDLVTSFRFNSWSPTSMAFLFEAFCL